jgi:hypothetical protein
MRTRARCSSQLAEQRARAFMRCTGAHSGIAGSRISAPGDDSHRGIERQHAVDRVDARIGPPGCDGVQVVLDRLFGR